MALTFANKLSLPAMAGRQADWLGGDPRARTAFFRNDFTTGRHAEGGRVVSWPGGWTVQRDSAAYYTTASGALIAAADDVARVRHFDVDEMVRVLLMEASGGNILTNGDDFDLWTLNSVTKEADPDRLARTGAPMTKLSVPTLATGIVAVTLTVSLTTGVSHVLSVDAAVDQYQFLRFHGFGNGQAGVVFDLHNQVYQINTQWDAASIRLVTPGIVRCTAVVTPAANGTVYIGMTGGMDGTGDVPAGSELSCALALLHPGVIEQSYSDALRDADKVFRADLAALGANTAAGFWHEVKMSVQDNANSFPRVTYSDNGDGANRNHVLLNNNGGTLGIQQYVSGASRGASFIPYVHGSMEHLFARFGDPAAAEEDALQLIASGVFVSGGNPSAYVPSTTFVIGGYDPEGTALGKPEELEVATVGLHPPSLTRAEAIDASALVKTVAQIEGVVPLLDLDFENRAFSLDGKARGLSNILTHARDSAAYGVLSDGRIASHPDDFPRLTFESGVRAHLGEADVNKLSIKSTLAGFGSSGGEWAAAPTTGTPPVLGTTIAPDGVTTVNFYSIEDAAFYWTTSGEAVSGNDYVNGAWVRCDEDGIGETLWLRKPGLSGGTVDPSRHSSIVLDGTWQFIEATRFIEVGETTWNFLFENRVAQGAGGAEFGLAIWGAGIEPGTKMSSVLESDGSPVSRADDLSSVDLSPLGDVFDDGFCFLFDFVCPDPIATSSSYGRLLSIGENLIHFASAGASVVVSQQVGGSPVLFRSSAHTAGQRYRIAGRFSQGQLGVSLNGSAVQSGVPGAYASPSGGALYMGASNATGSGKPGQILTRRLTLLRNNDLSNAQLQAIAGALS